MPLPVLLDVHVPISVTDAIRRAAIDAVTAQEADLALADDERLLEAARMAGRVLVTQDADFLEIVPRWGAEGRPCGGVIFARQGTAIGLLIDDLILCLEVLSIDEVADRVVFLPLA